MVHTSHLGPKWVGLQMLQVFPVHPPLHEHPHVSVTVSETTASACPLQSPLTEHFTHVVPTRLYSAAHFSHVTPVYAGRHAHSHA